MSIDPIKLAGNVREEATELKNSIADYFSNLFAGDEGICSLIRLKQHLTVGQTFSLILSIFTGVIHDISFDPMKVVTDTVEEFVDRKDMFLAYLSNMLIKDKGIDNS